MSDPRSVGDGESHIELATVALPSEDGREDADDADDDDTALLLTRRTSFSRDDDGAPTKPRGDEPGSTPASAVAMYAGGVLASSLTALGARLLHDRGVAIHYVVLGRAMLGMIFVCVGLYAYRGGVPNPLGERRAVLCLRGAIGTSAIYAFFVTSAYLPLADAAVATFVSPLVTAAGASLILRETPHRAIWCAIPVCACGGVLVVQPEFAFGSERSRHLSPVGVAAAGATAVLGGASKIVVRVLSGGLDRSGSSRGADGERIRKEHPLTIMWFQRVLHGRHGAPGGVDDASGGRRRRRATRRRLRLRADARGGRAVDPFERHGVHRAGVHHRRVGRDVGVVGGAGALPGGGVRGDVGVRVPGRDAGGDGDGGDTRGVGGISRRVLRERDQKVDNRLRL